MNALNENKFLLPAIALSLFFVFVSLIHFSAGGGPWLLVSTGKTIYHVHHDFIGLALIFASGILIKVNYFEHKQLTSVLKFIALFGLILVIHHLLAEGFVLIDVFVPVA